MAEHSYGRTNGTTRAQAIVDTLEEAMFRHPAWQKVDTATNPSTGAPCSVWRNSGAFNSSGKDFYVYILRESNNPYSVYLSLSEGYDPDTNAAIRPLPGANANTAVPDDFDWTATGANPVPLWTSGAGRDASQMWWADISGNSIYDVFAVVHNDTVFISRVTPGGTSNASVITLGLGESLMAEDPGLLLITGTDATDNTVTRFPFVKMAQAGNWKTQPALVNTWTPKSGRINGFGDLLHGSRPVAARFLIQHEGAPDTHGGLRGLVQNAVALDYTTARESDIPQPGARAFIGTDEYLFPGITAGKVWISLTAP